MSTTTDTPRVRSLLRLVLLVSVLLLVLALYGLVATWHYQTGIRQQITSIQTHMRALVQQLDNNTDAPALVSTIADCPANEQARYDQDLTKLATLQGPELQTVAQLFRACALSHPERRMIMAHDLQTGEAAYEANVALVKRLLWPVPAGKYSVSVWQQLVNAEASKASQMMDLVTIQGKIIDARVGGDAPTSTTIATLLGQAVIAKQKLTATNAEIKRLETTLAGL